MLPANFCLDRGSWGVLILSGPTKVVEFTANSRASLGMLMETGACSGNIQAPELAYVSLHYGPGLTQCIANSNSEYSGKTVRFLQHGLMV